ncbi:unnamed protein product [Owenia fusiformis]|uniref:Uncharacterized protein n=1 Tax=Owenia fusiformis TaxID=6347 RepID=A0A8J1YC41_OWEFU|nr:unnamed protein product [Owenia fusiformis]
MSDTSEPFYVARHGSLPTPESGESCSSRPELKTNNAEGITSAFNDSEMVLSHQECSEKQLELTVDDAIPFEKTASSFSPIKGKSQSKHLLSHLKLTKMPKIQETVPESFHTVDLTLKPFIRSVKPEIANHDLSPTQISGSKIKNSSVVYSEHFDPLDPHSTEVDPGKRKPLRDMHGCKHANLAFGKTISLYGAVEKASVQQRVLTLQASPDEKPDSGYHSQELVRPKYELKYRPKSTVSHSLVIETNNMTSMFSDISQSEHYKSHTPQLPDLEHSYMCNESNVSGETHPLEGDGYFSASKHEQNISKSPKDTWYYTECPDKAMGIFSERMNAKAVDRGRPITRQTRARPQFSLFPKRVYSGSNPVSQRVQLSSNSLLDDPSVVDADVDSCDSSDYATAGELLEPGKCKMKSNSLHFPRKVKQFSALPRLPNSDSSDEDLLTRYGNKPTQTKLSQREVYPCISEAVITKLVQQQMMILGQNLTKVIKKTLKRNSNSKPKSKRYASYCQICETRSHSIFDCAQRHPNSRVTGVRACFKCGNDHRITDCPSLKEGPDQFEH